jgi:hypothetical protein
LIAELGGQPEFRSVIIATAWQEYERRQRQHQRAGDSVAKQICELERQGRNLAKAVRLGGKLNQLVVDMKDVESELKRLRKAQKEQGTSCKRR